MTQQTDIVFRWIMAAFVLGIVGAIAFALLLVRAVELAV